MQKSENFIMSTARKGLSVDQTRPYIQSIWSDVDAEFNDLFNLI